MPLVVFATAFEDYAIRAFEENSIDYLLKPVEPERLERTVQKLNKLHTGEKQAYNQQLLQLLGQLKPKKELTSISVKLGERILIVRLEETAYFEAEDKYVYLYTLDRKKYLIDYSLTALEEKLPPLFMRISRSLIINRDCVKEISKYFSGRYIFLLSDKAQSKLTSGLSYAEKIREMFEI